MFIPKAFYSEWDRIINEWFQNKQALSPLMDQKNTLSIDHVPEPFYGNLDSSIVIINLNPGTGLNNQDWSNQNKPGFVVNDIKNIGYSVIDVGWTYKFTVQQVIRN